MGKSGYVSYTFWIIELGGGFKYFLFSSYLGKRSNLTNIFHRGWNHQLENIDSHRFSNIWKSNQLNVSALEANIQRSDT